MKFLISLLAFASISCAHAAIEVYDDTCAKPGVIKHRWYFDAVNGNDTTGDGSRAKPWKTIQSVFAGTVIPGVPVTPATETTPALPGKPPIYIGARYQPIPSFYTDPVTHARTWGNDPKAPIKPGDALDLMSGNYGALNYGVYANSINPADFLTVEAFPGQTPVFTSITISGATKLYVHDVTVQSSLPAMPVHLISLGAQGTSPTNDKEFAQYPAQDIIFDRMKISSGDHKAIWPPSATAWTKDDWNKKPKNGFWLAPFSVRCISLTNSVMTDVAGGFAVGGEKVVVGNNTLNYFRDDAAPFYGNQLKMHHNRMTNSFATSEIHKDFFQGQIGRRFTGTTVNHYHDIVIDSNVMIGKTEPANTMYTYTQGINTFDEDWTNVKVTNNTIIAASCHGIGLGAVHNGEVANNTVMHDHLTVTPGCDRGGIGVAGGSHESKVYSDHVRMHHNLAEMYQIDLDHDNTWDNNLCTGNNCQWVPFHNGAWDWGYGPKPDDTNKNDKQFTQYAPQGLRYNMTAPKGSLADTMGAGAK